MKDPHDQPDPGARPTVTGLAGRLKALRLATRPQVSQAAAGKEIGSVQNKISRIESGAFVPTGADIRKLGRLYGAPRAEVTVLVEWAEALQPGQVKSGTMLRRRGGPAAFQARIAKMEQSAKLVRAYQPGMVLGQLQTAAYASQVFSGDPDGLRERLARHRLLLEDTGRRWQLVQPVGALLWNLGGPEVMAEQMDHLVEVTALPHVDLRIISERRTVNFTATHGFHIYDEQAVVVGILTGTTIDQDAGAIRQYVEQFERLHAVGSTGDEARTVLVDLAELYRTASDRNETGCPSTETPDTILRGHGAGQGGTGS